MASEEPKKRRNTKSKNFCFPSCFEFPGKDSSRKRHWLSWSRFRIRKSERKTVPVYVAVVEKSTRGREPEEISGNELTNPVAIAPLSDQKAAYGNEMLQSDAQIPESRTTPDTPTSAKTDTCHILASFTNRKNRQRKIGSQPGSPRSSPVLPLNARAQPDRISPLSGRKPIKLNDAARGKLDPTVGMYVLMVTLAIMILCGRICAIICTSAWFYFIPCLRKLMSSGEIVGDREQRSLQDIDSDEYKKKVIVEGLMERNHRSPGRDFVAKLVRTVA